MSRCSVCSPSPSDPARPRPPRRRPGRPRHGDGAAGRRRLRRAARMELDTALDHAVELRRQAHPRERAVVAPARQRRRAPDGAGRRAEVRLPRIDILQAAAAERGIKLQLTIAGPAPAWATGDHKVGNNAPDPVKFAAFARTVAAHFKGRVDRYSIWNEPNWNTWLVPGQSAPSVPPALQRRLQRGQDRRPEGQGAVRRARPERRRPRDRAAEVPARRHLLERRYKATRRARR